MLDSRLLDILRCPETHQILSLLSENALADLNREISLGRVKNTAGRQVSAPLSAALIRQDGGRIYPIVEGIPVMLLDESISPVR